MTHKNFCFYPFTAFSIDNAGKTRICCNNDGWDRVFLNKSISDMSFNIDEEYNNDFHKEVRRYMIEDKRHPTCKKCWEIEDQGQISWRQWFNESFVTNYNDRQLIDLCQPDGTIKKIDFLYLDITFGNRCNLKCIMCNGYNSTLFLKEELETNQINNSVYEKLIKLDWYQDIDLFEKIYKYTDNVQRIHILGGEPLIIDHQNFLQRFIDTGISKNITISYNSNLTKLPNEILNCWKEFKRVYLCVSIDAVGELNEFIRYPMKWKKMLTNLEEIHNLSKTYGNITIQIHSTFSSLNILHMTIFLDWVKEVTIKYDTIECHPMFNYVYKPEWADPVHMPLELKKSCYDKYKKWIKENQLFLSKFHNDIERFNMLTSYYEKIIAANGSLPLYYQFKQRIQFYESIRNIKYPEL